jgi:hypothetical protein
MPILWLALAACREPDGEARADTAAPELLAQGRVESGSYQRFGSEYVWSKLTVRLQTPEGNVVAEQTAAPRVEAACGEVATREGALQSLRCWHAGGGYEVDLVRRGGDLALVRVPIVMAGATGPEETWLSLPVPEGEAVGVMPVWEAPDAWLDVREEGNGLLMRVLSGDREVASAYATAKPPCARTGPPDPYAIEAWDCSDGRYVVRQSGYVLAIEDPTGSWGAHFLLPAGIRPGW